MSVGTDSLRSPRRRANYLMIAGAVVALLSLWLGTFPLTIYSPGDADETTCGDAWNALQDALPAPCYSTFYWTGWLARVGLVVGVVLFSAGLVSRARNRTR